MLKFIKTQMTYLRNQSAFPDMEEKTRRATSRTFHVLLTLSSHSFRNVEISAPRYPARNDAYEL